MHVERARTSRRQALEVEEKEEEKEKEKEERRPASRLTEPNAIWWCF